jgi:hypothetical protein
MTWLILGAPAIIAMFAPIGAAIGKFVLGRFGRIAIVDPRDEELFL